MQRVAGLLAAVAGATLLWLLFAPKPLPVETMPAVRGPMQVTVNNQGYVRSHDKYVIAAPVAGEVDRIELREGDAVEPGQVVATLRPMPLDARQQEEAMARMESTQAQAEEAGRRARRAETDLKLAASERRRAQELMKTHFMSEQAADRAAAAEQAAQAELDAARSREQAAIADLRGARAAMLAIQSAGKPGSKIELSAPVRGYAIKIHEQSVRAVAAGTPLLVVNDPARYELVVDVLSTDAVKIRPGNEVLIENWGGAGALRASVRLVEPVAFTKVSALGVEEQRVNVIADPVGDLGTLGDGYRIEARIVIWSQDNVLKVPGSSLFRAADGWRVFTVERGRARERKVDIGQRNQDEAQVLDGLAPGAMLVRYPSNDMKDGVRVSPR
ncbi:efflux RND transporter periplasmic adaptor subunit [Noviherbaspirillum galbum]|uniref:HlyD family efflux transporter periplasmic adaptor subunit n=1 Tax=Noviherbaspirillum galbum TaxID=2709383 RepID=A0A6B3SNM8_9BURK|nr:HlyD family efflux transporter periplasmic adaptor subunit [Noviherbaspirillum galbum]NEX62353.1 HlyD family efflux transporter periplasmic adaptor subunit [Noviherbaspirillum galbum]